MPMLSAAQAGPLGVGDRGMQNASAPGPDQGADTDPCPCCQGTGEVPAGTSTDDLIAKMQQEDMSSEGQEPGASPTPSASELQSSSSMSPERAKVREYAQNRPSPFAHQPINEDQVLSEGARIRKRMSTSGLRGNMS